MIDNPSHQVLSLKKQMQDLEKQNKNNVWPSSISSEQT